MVAIIRSSSSAKRCCQYNETKVAMGLASCIMAGNYPCEPDDLSPRQRMLVLQKRLDLNARCKKGCLHIVLSFHAQDKLTGQQLGQICQTYMDHIGLGQQPFLVYQHLDTLHPHLHLVTVTIKADGSGNRIFHTREAVAKDTVRQIEKQYQLTASQGRTMVPAKLESAQKLQYGKSPAALAISQVLSVVLPHFKYCSMTELNAILRHYNVVANTGRPGSKTHRHQGLSYQMLNDDGRKMGPCVKASRLFAKPTLRYLHERFKENSQELATRQQRIRTQIELALVSDHTRSLADLGEHLSRQGVRAVYGFGQSGRLSEIVFVDFRARAACSATQLGDRCTPSGLAEIFSAPGKALENGQAAFQSTLRGPTLWEHAGQTGPKPNDKQQISDSSDEQSLLKLLLEPGPEQHYLPWELKKRRRKKRQQISLQL